MIQRIRDATRNFKPQGQVSFREWELITDRFAYAKKFLSDINPIYVELKDQLKAAEDDILENRLREVHNFDFNNFTQSVQRIFITPKKVQDDETVGQIKFIRALLSKLEFWIFEKEDYEKKEADGFITIDRGDKR